MIKLNQGHVFLQAETITTRGSNATQEISDDAQPSNFDGSLLSQPLDSSTQTELTASNISQMEGVVRDHYTNVYLSHNPSDVNANGVFNVKNFENDVKMVTYYTGVPNFKVLKSTFEFIRNHVKPGKCLTQFEEFIIVLSKPRLNLGMQDLAYRCSISLSKVSRILHKWLIVMDIRLTPACIVWPLRENLRKTMPECFTKTFGKKVVVIIDCFEIFVDRPSNVMARAETWSQYKHHNTVKFLIGITPQGVVSFISKGWGGRVSDAKLWYFK